MTGDADFYDFRQDDDDYYSQPRALFLLMSDEQKQALFDNTAGQLRNAMEMVRERHIANCTKCHPDYGKGVREALERMDPKEAVAQTDPHVHFPFNC